MTTYAYEDIVKAIRGPFSRLWRFSLALVVILQFSLITNASWRAQPDAALYLELGESLASGRGYVFNGELHTYVPPGYPTLVALVNILVGKSFFHYRILMSLLGLMTGLLSYFLIVRLCGKDAALVLGGFCLTNHVLLENSTITCSDTFFAFSVFLAIHALLWLGDARSRFWFIMTALSGLIAGLPGLIRVNGLGIPPALAFHLARKTTVRSFSRRVFQIALFLFTGAVPVMMWELYKLSFPKSMNEGTYMTAVIGRDLSTQVSIMLTALKDYAHEITYVCTGLSIKTGFLEFAIPILIIIGLIKLMRKGERLFGPIMLIQMAGLCLSPAGGRYLIALMPAFSIFLVAGLTYVAEAVMHRTTYYKPLQSLRNHIAPLFILVLIVLNLCANTITVVQARSAMEPNGPESYRDAPFFVAGSWLKQNAHSGPIMTMHPRVLNYVAGLPTVELVRSGVPENKAFISSQDELTEIILFRKPTYFFSDNKNPIMKAEVESAFQRIGATLHEIPDIDPDGRFSLWKVRYP